MSVADGGFEPRASDARRVVLSIPADVRFLRTVRRAVTATLEAARVRPALTDATSLVVSELTTNAITHGDDGRVRVILDCGGRLDVALRVEQADLGETLPAIDDWAPSPMGVASGRGLGIVRRLARRVEVDRAEGGLAIAVTLGGDEV